MYVLPYYELQAIDFTHTLRQLAERESQVPARIFKALARASNGEGLTRAASLQYVDRTQAT